MSTPGKGEFNGATIKERRYNEMNIFFIFVAQELDFDRFTALPPDAIF